MSAYGNLTLAEKNRERQRRAKREDEKQAKEEAEKERKKPAETSASKYGKALCKYAWRGNVKRCQRCVRKGASIEFTHPISLARPLHRACLGGSLEVAKWLVEEKGAMINVMDDEEWRPIHFAASRGNIDLCAYLVLKGAEVNCRDMAGNTPIQLALGKGLDDCVDALVKMGAQRPATRALVIEDNETTAADALPGTDTDPMGEYWDATNVYEFEHSSDEA